MGEHADTAFNTTGSKWLQPVSEYLGFPLDQVGASAPEIELIPQYFLSYDALWLTLVLSVVCQLTWCHLLRDTRGDSLTVDAHIAVHNCVGIDERLSVLLFFPLKNGTRN